ncbi:claudin-18-like [Glandiceps talaboti]
MENQPFLQTYVSSTRVCSYKIALLLTVFVVIGLPIATGLDTWIMFDFDKTTKGWMGLWHGCFQNSTHKVCPDFVFTHNIPAYIWVCRAMMITAIIGSLSTLICASLGYYKTRTGNNATMMRVAGVILLISGILVATTIVLFLTLSKKRYNMNFHVGVGMTIAIITSWGFAFTASFLLLIPNPQRPILHELTMIEPDNTNFDK